MKLYRNYVVLWSMAAMLIGYAAIELIGKEKELGYQSTNWWPMLSTFGKGCVVAFAAILVYWFVTVFVKDRK